MPSGSLSVLVTVVVLQLAPLVEPLLCNDNSLLDSMDIGGVYFRLLPAGTCRPINSSSDIQFWVQPPGSSPKSKHEILSLDDDDERVRSFFDPSLPTAVYVHGFFEGAKASSMRAVRSAYLLRKDHNFMAVNWQMLASAPWYPKAVVYFPMVARNLAQILDRLVTVGAIRLETLHLIGFSLGSHVCGAAAKLMTVGRVPRITALDPAYPLITSLPREQRLDNTTADFIDVIHTCGGLYGLFLPVGHADFYPNGGTYVQPGCWTTFAPFTCSHWRSWRFFVESLMGSEFVATSCDSWKNFQQGKCNNNHKAIMGQEVDQTSRGVFYLKTNWDTPYALH